LSWEKIVKKFESLCPPSVDRKLREKIVNAVGQLEEVNTAQLMKLLGKVSLKTRR
jgi:hypothetical protein